MKNFNDWLNESLQGDDAVKAQLVKHINAKIADLKTKNAKAVADASKIVDVNSIIEQCRAYLIKSIPTVVAGLKSGKGGDAFAASFVSFANGIIKKELDEVGFIKRGAAKLLAPDKATYLAQAKMFDATPFIFTLRSCLDLALAVGFMDSTEPYANQLWSWENGLDNWFATNESKIKGTITNTFATFLYA